MGRKPRIQARGKHMAKPPRAGRRIYQCMHCGALTDPIYGMGNNSWCPSCHATGDICYDEGKIPDPAFYGGWLARQKETSAMDGTPRKAGQTSKPASNPVSTTPAPLSIFGGLDMKLTQYHNGLYHCPTCCMEFDLCLETVLKCEHCGGRLVKGSLDDDPDEDEDEDE